MKLYRYIYILILLMIYPALGSAREAWRGWCEIGGSHVTTSGLVSTTTVQKSSSGCTVTVYVTGGALATIYSDNNGTPLANPFSADTVTGMWKFYAANGRYDVTNTSTNLGVVTYSDILICDPADVGSACGTTVGSGINFYNNGTFVALETGLNFIPGANITLTMVDNLATPTHMDVTINAPSTRGLVFTIGDPGGTALTASSTTTEYLTVPFSCTLSAYNLAIDAGTITVKFWKIASGTAIPTSANSINTSGVGISSGTAIQSSTLTDFTATTVTTGDIMAMNVTAVATAKYVNGVLACNQ